MSTLAIILIVAAVLVLVFLALGLTARRRLDRADADDYPRHVAAADQALEQARAADKGWERVAMEEVARAALAAERPGFEYDRLQLVLVDDRHGVHEDRAHFEAVQGDERVLVVLARGGSGAWTAEPLG